MLEARGVRIAPLADTERIFALPDRAAREAALLALEPNRRDMVSHFLILKFAKAFQVARFDDHAALLAGIPAALVGDVLPLAQSYIKAARMVAESKA